MLRRFEQQVWSIKIGDANALSIIVNKQLQKKTKNKKKQKQTNVATLNSANQAKKQFNFGTGWLEP